MYWAPKGGSLWTKGRLFHLLTGILAPAVAFRLGGYEALGWVSLLVLVFACSWEALTYKMSGPFRWAHRYGDIVDLMAFVVGWILGALVSLM